jgi:hypothetical protein
MASTPRPATARARYLVRAMPPAEFVALMLRRLGFAPEQASEIMDEIAYAPRARLLTKRARRATAGDAAEGRH